MLGGLLFPAAAMGSEAVEVSGIVKCFGAPVVGVYVHATQSRSDFADWWVDPGEMGMEALTGARYRFTLDHGGSYKLSVGCGGTRDHWATVVESVVIHTDVATTSCNDVHPLLAAVGEEVFGSVVPFIGWDFSGPAEYGQCVTDSRMPSRIPDVGPTGPLGTVLASTLNVRSDASVNAPILFRLQQGTTVTIECQKRGDSVFHVYWTDLWDRVTVNGVTGFAADAWIETGGPAQVAPDC